MKTKYTEERKKYIKAKEWDGHLENATTCVSPSGYYRFVANTTFFLDYCCGGKTKQEAINNLHSYLMKQKPMNH